ncbi:MAG: hypothetical protein QM795_14045 [Pseudoxanthomonas sp.]
MNDVDATSGTQVERYAEVPWGKIQDIQGHPLEFLIGRGIPVYYKLHRGCYFVCTYGLTPVARPLGTEMVFGPPLEAFTFQKRYDLILLRLDDEDLLEILKTGNRGLLEFSLGGLALPEQEEGQAGADTPLVAVDFNRACLVRKGWQKQSLLSSNPTQSFRMEDNAEPIWAGFEDIYLEACDVAEIRKGGFGKEYEPYPLAARDRTLPAPMYWLYQAAFALNRDGEVVPAADEEDEASRRRIESWLRVHPTEKELFHKRWIRTAVNLVALGYKFRSRFTADKLDRPELTKGKALVSGHVSMMLTLALAATEWWLDQNRADFEAKQIELAGMLEELGFEVTAVLDLTGMITGAAITDSKLGEFRDKLDAFRSKKAMEAAKRASKAGNMGAVTYERKDSW